MKRLALALFVTRRLLFQQWLAVKLLVKEYFSTVVAANISLPKINQHVGSVQTSLMQCLQTWRTPQNYGCFYHL